MTKRLYVGNVNYRTNEDGLRDFFAQYGAVESVTLIKDRETGRAKGYGFVEMVTEDAAKLALQNANGAELDGRALRVDEAVQRSR